MDNIVKAECRNVILRTLIKEGLSVEESLEVLNYTIGSIEYVSNKLPVEGILNYYKGIYDKKEEAGVKEQTSSQPYVYVHEIKGFTLDINSLPRDKALTLLNDLHDDKLISDAKYEHILGILNVRNS